MPDKMPQSVAWYERLSYAAIALSAVSFPLNWATIEKYLHKSPVVYPIAIVAVFLVQICWVRFVAREHRNWARWLTLAVSATGIIYAAFDFQARVRLGVASAIAYYAICIMFLVAAAFLFVPDATPWFRQPTDSNGN